MIDDWHDWLRLVIFLVSAAGLTVLAVKWFKHHKKWTEWDKDRWFAMLMWFAAAFEMQIEGILRDTGPRGRLALVLAAVFVTLRLITKKYDKQVCTCSGRTPI